LLCIKVLLLFYMLLWNVRRENYDMMSFRLWIGLWDSRGKLLPSWPNLFLAIIGSVHLNNYFLRKMVTKTDNLILTSFPNKPHLA
jgi:hypothetical protein